MELLRLLVVHTLIGTSVALGMVIAPAIAWFVQRMATGDAPKSPRMSSLSLKRHHLRPVSQVRRSNP